MRRLPNGFDIYLLNVKTMRPTAQIFVRFLEKLSFMICINFVAFSKYINFRFKMSTFKIDLTNLFKTLLESSKYL